MSVLRKLYLVPNVIEGNILKPMRRRLNKFKVKLLRASEVRARNQFAINGKPEFLDVKENLKAYGFSKITEDVLSEGEVESFVLKAKELIATKELKSEENKKFWQRPLSGTSLDSEHFLVKFAMHDHILSIVSEYIQGLPLLNSVELIRSIDNGEDGWSRSQLWHKDHDDLKMLKLFIYLTDVKNYNDGPFEYFESGETKAMRLRYSPVHKTDAVINSASVYEHSSVFGEIGTCFVIDTSQCLHRGSRVRGEANRLVYIATYTSCCRLVPKKQGIQVSDKASSFTAALITPIDF